MHADIDVKNGDKRTNQTNVNKILGGFWLEYICILKICPLLVLILSFFDGHR